MKEKLKTYSPYKLILWAGLLLLVIIYFDQFLAFFNKTITVIRPLLLGSFLALVVNLLLKRIERVYFPKSKANWVQKTRRPVSLILALLSIVLVIILAFYIVIPELMKVVVDLGELIQGFFAGLGRNIQDIQFDYPELLSFLEYFNIDENTLVSYLEKGLDQVLNVGQNIVTSTFNTAGNVVSVAVDGVVALMVAIYILSSKEKIKSELGGFCKARLSEENYVSLSKIVKLTYNIFDDFFVGQIIEALITGVLVYVGMLIVRLPHAMTNATLTGVLSILPMIGPILAGVIGFLLIFLQNAKQGLIFLVFIIVVQQVEGNIIYPRLMGSKIGLPSLWVLVAVTIGGGMFGIFGTLLMVPVFATLYKLMKNYTSYKKDLNAGVDMEGRHWVDG